MNPPYHFVPDLYQEVASNLDAALSPPNIQGRAIYADSVVKVLLLPFHAGQVLAEHTTPHAAIMQVIKGRGRITLGGERKDVQAGSWVRMQGGLPHSIHAETELVLLLQVFLDSRTTVPAARPPA